MKYAIQHPTLGEVTVSQTARARRISLSVRPTGEIRLSLPKSVSRKEAMRFLDSKQEWVRAAVERFAESHPKVVIVPPFRTRSRELVLMPVSVDAQSSNLRVVVSQTQIKVYHPDGVPPECAEVQQAVRKGIEAAWRAEAREILPVRVEELARLHALSYNSVTVRNTVSRWGSCTTRRDLSLSLHLMRLPEHLVDYVILHELCHTVHPNHSPSFYALLDKLTGGRNAMLRKEMKKYNPRW